MFVSAAETQPEQETDCRPDDLRRRPPSVLFCSFVFTLMCLHHGVLLPALYFWMLLMCEIKRFSKSR